MALQVKELGIEVVAALRPLVARIRRHDRSLAGSAEQEPALAALASAAVGGAAPAGPERRERPAIALGDASSMRVAAALSVAEGGFSLHAATTAAADDAAGREALCKYVLRPPLAQERLHLLDDGLVRIELKRPFSDLALSPALLETLLASRSTLAPLKRHIPAAPLAKLEGNAPV